MMPRIELAVPLLAAMILVACGGGQASAPKSVANIQNITVKSTDQMRFEPSTLTVQSNSPVSVTLDNSGAALVHDFTIDQIGGQKVTVKAQPNGRATIQFTPAVAGTYQFYCAEPGHKEAGMVGSLIVR
jgi:uncharacterized cupredoxin-like copper-binding protein